MKNYPSDNILPHLQTRVDEVGVSLRLSKYLPPLIQTYNKINSPEINTPAKTLTTNLGIGIDVGYQDRVFASNGYSIRHIFFSSQNLFQANAINFSRVAQTTSLVSKDPSQIERLCNCSGLKNKHKDVSRQRICHLIYTKQVS